MQFLDGMEKPFLAARYVSLWNTAHKHRQLDNNITFYVYKETIRHCIEYMSRIQSQIVEAYKDITRFKRG
jgi:hypothetical protein